MIKYFFIFIWYIGKLVYLYAMRELTFRVWDNVDYMSNSFTFEDLVTGKTSFVKGLPVMQYIGLDDQNGNKIFDGDIIKTHWQHDGATNFDYEIIGEIQYDEGRSEFVIVNEEYRFPLYSWEREQFMDRDNDNEIEVLGNIYENKNLLNEK